MTKLFGNSGDPDQTPHSAASDLGLHCLPITLLRVSRQQWVKPEKFFSYLSMKTYFVGHGYAIELSHQGAPDEYTQYRYMFSWRNKKNTVPTWIPFLSGFL